MSPSEFLTITTNAPRNAHLLADLPGFNLPDCHIVAGCLFQSVWNHRSGLPLERGIKDWDVFYFDPDTSYEAEDKVIKALAAHFGDWVEVRNQARVHLWYQQKFGHRRAPLISAADGIGSFLVECSCVGIHVQSGDLVAPFGLADLWAGRLVENRFNNSRDLFMAKAESYRSRWPWLIIENPLDT